jgi:hypothetical protein
MRRNLNYLKSKDDSGMGHAHYGRQMRRMFLCGSLKGRGHFQDLVTDGISTSDSRERIMVKKFVFRLPYRATA